MRLWQKVCYDIIVVLLICVLYWWLEIRIVDMAKPTAISSFRYVPTSANQAAD